ncbi:MAG TPA: hypothetical protein VGK84_08600 [Candidatus Tumulicola sp.]|jgi:hypothetical protein
MKSYLRYMVATLAVAALASAAPAVAGNNAMSGSTTWVKVTLNAQNNSGETGTAKITESSKGIVVVINIKGAPASAQPAHIHTGSCPTPGGVKYPLKDVVNGTSKTTIKGVTIAELTASPMSINVHESAADLQKYVSCGDITQ